VIGKGIREAGDTVVIDNFIELSDLIKDAETQGILLRDYKPTTDDVLCGYMQTKDERWALRQLISLYEYQRNLQPFKKGDIVRVQKSYWHIGFSGGWNGFAPMFADEVGTVTKVEWSPTNLAWVFLVEYETEYRYADYSGGQFYVHDNSVSFSFWPEYLEKVASND